MNIAEEMREIANEAVYCQYRKTICSILKLINEAAKDGQYKIILLTTEFPELNNLSVQNWFHHSGFQIVTYDWDSAQTHKINICWGIQ